MQNKSELYNNVNQHIADLMTLRRNTLYPEIFKDEVKADPQQIPFMEMMIDEGRKFFLPIIKNNEL